MEPVFINKICYFGDDGIPGAAVYLCGIMKHYGLDYVHVNSTDRPSDDFQKHRYAMYIISDYPSRQFRPGDMEHIAGCVHDLGSGFLMIGGWESFHGKDGEYNQTPLAAVAPVHMQEEDDRRCSPLGILITRGMPHEITEGLDWKHPGGVVGYNAVVAKKGTTTLLYGTRFDICILSDEVDEGRSDIASLHSFVEQITMPLLSGDACVIRPQDRAPLLVVGQYGQGRTAAFTSDLAPHWVGGFVDWGRNRVFQNVESESIEVGESYAVFVRNLIQWTAGIHKN